MKKYVVMPYMIWDRQYLRDEPNPDEREYDFINIVDWFKIPHEEEFLDGPVTSQIAVLDFDAERGGLRPGTKFIPHYRNLKTISLYDARRPYAEEGEKFFKDCEETAFVQVSTFATVMKIIKFFESPDALGRRVVWAFDSQQLLVIPRAGMLANAFYQRDSGSLQFFYFPSNKGYLIYTTLSFDVIAHETAHAILDGVVPDLYNSTRTQCLALHEAIADITAIILTSLNEFILWTFLDMHRNVDITDVLSKFAEEFGSEMRRDIGMGFLRGLKNDLVLDSDSVDLADHYKVSQVMSGAIFQVFMKCIEHCPRDKYDNRDFKHYRPIDRMDTDQRCVYEAGRTISKLVFRALDYLPPGEVSFADFGRAMIAAHRAVRGDKQVQRWLTNELIKRKLVKNESELEGNTDIIGNILKGVNCQALLKSDATAKHFAETYRELLHIPNRSDFKVQPRRIRTRVRSWNRKQKAKHDLIFRVIWDVEEKHDLGSRFATQWRYTVGTTLVLDWSTSKVLSILTTDQGEIQHSDRDRTLRHWIKQGLLMTPEEAMGPDGKPLVNKIIAKKTGRTMAVTGSARILCT